MSGTIEAVVFDFDGLLVDSEDITFRACQQVCYEFGVEITDEHRLDLMRSKLSSYLVDRFELSAEPSDIRAKFLREFNLLNGDLAPIMPGATKAVDVLGSKYPLALGSGAHSDRVLLGLEHHGLAGRFNPVVCINNVKEGKPAPDIYLKAAEGLGIDPEACLAIEDQPRGVESAKSAGMLCLAVPSCYIPEADFSHADMVIPHLGLVTLELVSDIEKLAI